MTDAPVRRPGDRVALAAHRMAGSRTRGAGRGFWS